MPSERSQADMTPLRPNTLALRVEGRVSQARRAIDRRGRTDSPKSERLRPTRKAKAAVRTLGNSDAERETRSLFRVYAEMKTIYQEHRRQTGRPAIPALREAVQAFRRGPSIPALVRVAAFLDDRELLAW